jgi:hypothetical protein
MNGWVQTIMALLIIYSGMATYVCVLLNRERRHERAGRLYWKHQYYGIDKKEWL